MATAAVTTGGGKKAAVAAVLSPDRPLDLSKVRRGYHNAQREYDYWVPSVDIEGEIPRALHGTLYRNGPGLVEVYGTKLLHPIDGDGMVVALTFIDGKVHLRSRFVASKHHVEEQHQRKYIYRGQMGTHPNSALKDTALFLKGLVTFSMPRLQYRNPSNTNVFYWGGKVVSVYETGLPHVMDPHTLDTLGPDNFNGALKLKQFAAHFRIDSENQRLICMGVRPGVGSMKPILALYEFDEAWNLHQRLIHSIPGLNYAHDFLLLPDYYILHMTPFATSDWWTVAKVYMGWTSLGHSVRHYRNLPSRFIVIPRHKQAKYQEIMQLDTEAVHIFHYGVSEQIGNDIITFNAVCLPPKFDMTYSADEACLTNASVAPGKVHSFTLHLDTGKCVGSKGPVDPASVEFPTTHPYRHGRSNTRYSYLMASDRGCNVPYRDVVKHDARGEIRQVWYSHGVVGEPVFVPRLGYDSRSKGLEDDGYVLVQLYVPETHTTEFVVLDAQRVDAGPLARIKLKHPIPYGFHGTFSPQVFVPPPQVLSPLPEASTPHWVRAKL